MDSLVGWNDALAALAVDKPEAGEQVTITPGTDQGIDISAIASLDAQFYQTGSNLWIVFEDGAVVIVEGYFDGGTEEADGTPRSVIVDGEAFTGEEFLTAFAIDDLPDEFAEGDVGAPETQQNGASFDDPSLGPLGNGPNGIGLLGNTLLSSTTNENGEETAAEDSTPTIGVIAPIENGLIDEAASDDLNGDTAFDTPLSVTGGLGVDFGANGEDSGADGEFQDAPTGINSGNRSIVFDAADVTASVPLESGGEPLTFALSQGGTVLTAFADGTPVFEVRLFDDGNGSYQFTLFQSLDHPVENTADTLALSFGFTANDSDDDSASGTFTVNVVDDVPEIGTPQLTTVDEFVLTSTVNEPTARVVGVAEFTGGDINGSPITFLASSGTGVQVDPISGGWLYQVLNGTTDALQFELRDNSGNVIVTGQVDPETRLFIGLDPADVAGQTVQLYTSADGAPFTSRGSDTFPDLGAETQDFDNWVDAKLTYASGDLNIDWGADNFDDPDTVDGQDTPDGIGDREVRFRDFDDTESPVRYLDKDGQPFALKSGGDEISYAVSEDGTQLFAFIDSAVGENGEFDAETDELIFTVTLSDDGTGSYLFELVGSIDHEKGVDDDDAEIDFAFTAVDSDGDPAEGTFRVEVVDDEPKVVGTIDLLVDEGDIANILSVGTTPFDGTNDDGNGNGSSSELALLPPGFVAQTTGSLNDIVDFGADGKASDGLATDDNFAFQANAIQTMDDLGLTSNNAGIVYEIINGTLLVGFVDGNGGGQLDSFRDRVILSVELDSDTGDFTVRQYDQLDHEGDGKDTDLKGSSTADGIDLGAIFEATDGDGDTQKLDGGVTLKIQDDTPDIEISLDRTVRIDESGGSANDNVTGLTGFFVSLLFSDIPIANRASDDDMSTVYARDDVVDTTVLSGTDDRGIPTVPVQRSLKLEIVGDQGDGIDSGIETTAGDKIILKQLSDDMIVGEISGGGQNGKIAFAIHMDGDGDVSVMQTTSLKHGGIDDADDTIDALAGKINAVLSVTDADGDTKTVDVEVGQNIKFDDDGPTVRDGQAENRKVDEDDILTRFDRIPGQNAGSDGTSPNDGDGAASGNDGSFTGDPRFVDNGAANVSGSLANLVDFGADGAATQGAFTFLEESTVRDALDQLGLTSKGASLSYSIEDNSGRQVLLGFDNDVGPDDDFDKSGSFQDRLVFRLTLNGDGSYDFELFDQLDHVKPDPDGSSDQNKDLANTVDANSPAPSIDFGSLIEATDGDGDTIGLGDGKFTITITDDIPVVDTELSGFFLTVDETPGRQSSGAADDVRTNNLTDNLDTFIDNNSDPDVIAAARDDLVNVANSFEYGADESGTVSLALTDSQGNAFDGSTFSGLLDTATGEQINLHTDQTTGVVYGKTANTGEIVFALDIENDGDVTIAQFRAVNHTNTNSTNEIANIQGVHATVTVTDADGDTVSDPSDVALTIRVRDDGPSTSANARVLLDDDDVAGADGNPGGPGDNTFNTPVNATGTLAHDFGADGGEMIALTGISIRGGLDFFSDISDDGKVLTLFQGGQTPTDAVLTVTLTDEEGGYRVDQLAAIEHPTRDGRSDDNTENNVEFVVSYQVTDGDGDTADGSLRINVDDDTPDPDFALNATDIVHDETPGVDTDTADIGTDLSLLFAAISPKGTDPDVGTVDGGAIGYARSNGPILTGSANPGADGGSTTYSIDVPGIVPGSGSLFSGLYTTDGQQIRLFEINANLIVGRYEDDSGNFPESNDPAAFAIHINSQTGVISTAQYVSIRHGNSADGDDTASIIDGRVRVTGRVADNDGDTASQSFRIGDQIVFQDDGPVVGNTDRIISDDDNVGDPDTGNPGRGGSEFPDDPTLPYIDTDDLVGDGEGIDAGTLGGDSKEFNKTGKLDISFGADGGKVAWDLSSNVIDGASNTEFRLNDDGSLELWQTQSGEAVLIVEIKLNETTGDYEVIQHAALAHEDNGQNDENNANFTLAFTVTDGDGDTADGTVILRLDDDTPSIRPYNTDPDRTIIAEGTVENGTSNDDGQEWNRVKMIDFSVGADGAAEGGAVAWDPLTSGPADGSAVGFSFETNDDGTLIISQDQGSAGKVVVAEVTMNSDTGRYEVIEKANVLHTGTNGDSASLTLKFTVTDGDGDTVVGERLLVLRDDTPIIKDPDPNPNLPLDAFDRPDFRIISDDETIAGLDGNIGFGDLANGQGGDSKEFHQSGKSLPISFGADGGEVVWDKSTSQVTGGVDVDVTTKVGEVTFDVADGVNDAGRSVSILSISQKQAAGEDPILIATVTLDKSSREYSYEQVNNLLHENKGNNVEDDATFLLGFIATDGDGDTLAETIDLIIDDDSPVVENDTADATENGGSIIIDVLDNDSFGADGQADTASVALDTAATIGSAVFNEADNTISYDPNGQFESLAVGETATDTFTYTITDSDGDTSQSATVTVTIAGTNDAPVITQANTSGSVHEPGAFTTNINGTSISFNPALGESGEYRISDAGVGGSQTFGTLDGLVQALADIANGSRVGDNSLQDAGPASGGFPNIVSTAGGLLSLGGNSVAGTVRYQFLSEDAAQDFLNDVLTPLYDQIDQADSVAGATELTASGVIKFTDADLTDAHTFSATPNDAGNLGTMTVGSNNGREATGGKTGEIKWRYSVDPDDLNLLAEGETRQEAFTVTIDDGNDGLVSRVITVTQVGANDAPVLSVTRRNDVDETTDTSDITTTINATFTDVDVLDNGHVGEVFLKSVGGNTGGNSKADFAALDLLKPGIVTTSDATTDGTIAFDFSAKSTVFDYLADGETVKLNYRVTVEDEHGGRGSKEVDIIITGTNDAPVIDLARSDVSGSVDEPGSLPGIVDANAGSGLEAIFVSEEVDSALSSLQTTPSDVIPVLETVQNKLGVDLPTAIAVVWDYLDDAYVPPGSPETNESFVRLGVEYAKYLEAGGSPLLEIVAKFEVDNNGNDIPQRQQSLHDNLLGNLNEGSLNSRFDNDPTDGLTDLSDLVELVESVNGGLINRDVVSGYEGTPETNAPAFDVANGYNVPSASGQLFADDVDNVQADLTWSLSSPNGTYGNFSINASTGEWTYELDSDRPVTQALEDGDMPVETFAVTVNDGAGETDIVTVNVTVNGSADTPAGVTMLIVDSDTTSGLGNFATIEAAVKVASAGDVIFIVGRTGDYAENVVIDKPLSFKSINVGEGDATIAPTSGTAVFLDGTNFGGGDVKFDGINLTGTNNALTGIDVEQGSNVGTLSFINGVISGFTNRGIYATDAADPANSRALDALVISNVEFGDNGDGGGNTAHIKLFGFDGDVNLKTVTFSGAAAGSAEADRPDSAIEIVGGLFNSGTGNPVPDEEPDIGTVVFDDVTVVGAYHKNPIAIFNFGEIDALSILDLDVSGATSIWGPLFNIDGVEDDTLDASGYNITFPAGSAITAELQGDKLGQDEVGQAITGTDGNDFLRGRGGDDALKGNAGNDFLVGDDFAPKASDGIDTAIFDGVLDASNIVAVADLDPGTNTVPGWQVDATTSGEGVDGLVSVEIVQGADPDGAGGSTGRFLLVGNGGFATIQEAVNAAVDGDTVLIAPGTYPEDVSIDGKAISLIGSGGPDSVFIEAGAGKAGVTVSGNFSGDVTIDGITVQNSDSGVSASGNSLTLANLAVQNAKFLNNAKHGVFVNGKNDGVGKVTVQDSTFENNGDGSSNGHGDIVLFEYRGDATLKNLVIDNNTGTADTAIQIAGFEQNDYDVNDPIGAVVIDNVQIDGTYTKVALYIQGYTDLTDLSLSDVSGLVAAGWGYATYIDPMSSAEEGVTPDTAGRPGSFNADGSVPDGSVDLSGVTLANTVEVSVDPGHPLEPFNGTILQSIVNGTTGGETIIGTDGVDLINGRDGDDVIIGGLGSDIKSGGGGEDTFVLNDLTSFDTILDFNTSEDRLDLSALLDGFADAAIATRNDGNGNTIVSVDQDGTPGAGQPANDDPIDVVVLSGVVDATIVDASDTASVELSITT